MAEFSHVSIFDLLSNDERRRDGETEKIEQMLSGRIGVSRHIIDTEEELFSELEALELRIRSVPTIIHFAAHGFNFDSDPVYRSHGLKISEEQTQVYWNDLREIMCDLNEATGGKLALNVMACRGGGSFKINDFTERDPYMVAAGPSLNFDAVKGLPMAECFYTSHLNDSREISKFARHVRAVNKAEGAEVLGAISSRFLREAYRLSMEEDEHQDA